MMSLWVNSHAYSSIRGSIVNKCIVSYMHFAIKGKGEIEHPYAFVAAEVHLNLLVVAFVAAEVHLNLLVV